MTFKSKKTRVNVLGLLTFSMRTTSARCLRNVLAVVACLLLCSASANPPIFDLGNLKTVPLLISSNHKTREGVLRIVNHSEINGSVTILACDDTGEVFGPITVPVFASETRYIDSKDLEEGNEGKGIFQGIGKGRGDWHVYLRSLLDIEVMAFARSANGFLTSTHDTVFADDDGAYHVSLLDFDDTNAHSFLIRLVNAERDGVAVNLKIYSQGSTDPPSLAQLTLDDSEAREIRLADLLLRNTYDDSVIRAGSQPARLTLDATFTDKVTNERPNLHVMYLKKIPDGYISNLSAPPLTNESGTSDIPYFPSPSDPPPQRKGLLLVFNKSSTDGQVRFRVVNETGEVLGELAKRISARQTITLTTREAMKTLESQDHSDASARRESSWRLEIDSDLKIETSAYLLCSDGSIAPIHDVVNRSGNRYRIPTVISAGDLNHDGVIRIVNATEKEAKIEIRSITGDQDTIPTIEDVSLLPGHTKILSTRGLIHSPTHMSASPQLSDTISEWLVTTKTPIFVQSMLVTLDGRVSNLSSAPNTYGYEDEFPGSDVMHIYNDNVLVMHVYDDVTEPLPEPPVPYVLEIYRDFDDVFDFLILLPNVDSWYSTKETTFGTYFSVMNDVEGIGRPLFLDTQFGSAGKLRGVITLNFSRALMHGPLLHELNHAWANYVIPTSYKSHWGFSSANGQLGGFDRKHLKLVESNVYYAGVSWNPVSNFGNSLPYSPIELYLAGFVEADQIPDIWVAPTGQWLESDQSENQTRTHTSLFVTDSTEIYTIEDIVNQHGKRVPDAKTSPRNFRAAVVLLVDENQPLFADDIAIVSEHARIFSALNSLEYESCRYRDPYDRWPYTRPCSGDLTRPWYSPGFASSGHRFYNYVEATGGRATLKFDELMEAKREK